MSSSRLRIPDPSLVLLIGSAGAGKSTFAARHFRPTEIVSSDRCRAMICDDESDQSVNGAAFSLLHHIVRTRLSLGRLTVVDATNLQTRARRPLLRLARAFQIPIVAIVFRIAPETCRTRNLARSHRQVSEEAIEQHAQELARALAQLGREGYRRVYVLDEAGVDRAVIWRAPPEQD
jgi:protein phosphatase